MSYDAQTVTEDVTKAMMKIERTRAMLNRTRSYQHA